MRNFILAVLVLMIALTACRSTGTASPNPAGTSSATLDGTQSSAPAPTPPAQPATATGTTNDYSERAHGRCELKCPPGALIASEALDAAAKAAFSKAEATLEKAAASTTDRTADELAQLRQVHRDSTALLNIKRKIYDMPRACGANCARAYGTLTNVVQQNRALLDADRTATKGKLAGVANGTEFDKLKSKIASMDELIGLYDATLQSPGTPECNCRTVSAMSADWLIRSASQKSSTEIIACVQQMRGAMLLNDEKAPSASAVKAATPRACEQHLARLESILYENGRRDQEKLKSLSAELTKLSFPDNKTAMEELVTQQTEIRARLAETKRLLVLPDDQPLHQTFDDYDRYLSKLSAGVEYTSLGSVFGTGLPRLGYTARLRYGGRGIPELRPEAGRSWRFGFEHAFSAFLTNSGAQNVLQTTAPAGSALPKAERSDKVVPALRIETTLFWPTLRTARINQRLRSYAGPILLLGAQLADADDPPPTKSNTAPSSEQEERRADSRLYAGFRAALSPETFADFMVGKNRSLHEWRAEVRGQVPVFRISDRTRVSLGATGNFALERPPLKSPGRRYEDRDSVTIFLSWDADFKLPSAEPKATGQ